MKNFCLKYQNLAYSLLNPENSYDSAYRHESRISSAGRATDL